MKPTYESPLASRYASKYMLHLFSPDSRFETWRRLWVALAQAQHDLGLPVTQEQVDELAAHVSPIDYDVVSKKEKEIRQKQPLTVLYKKLGGKNHDYIITFDSGGRFYEAGRAGR